MLRCPTFSSVEELLFSLENMEKDRYPERMGAGIDLPRFLGFLLDAKSLCGPDRLTCSSVVADHIQRVLQQCLDKHRAWAGRLQGPAPALETALGVEKAWDGARKNDDTVMAGNGGGEALAAVWQRVAVGKREAA